MAIKPDYWIRSMAQKHGMIDPFMPEQVSEGAISYGLSSYGYDLRLADEFKIFAPPAGQTINPKSIPAEFYRDHRGAFCDIPPHFTFPTFNFQAFPDHPFTLPSRRQPE